MTDKRDITGRRQLVRNVVVNYLGYAVLVVFGFVMPRAIDNSIGQAGFYCSFCQRRDA